MMYIDRLMEIRLKIKFMAQYIVSKKFYDIISEIAEYVIESSVVSIHASAGI